MERYRVAYDAYVDLLLRNWFNPDDFTETATFFHELIEPHLTQGDGDRFYYGPTTQFSPEDFNSGLDELITLTSQRHDYIRAELARSGGTR